MGTRLAAYLSYRDAPAALRWLEALGFEVVRRSDAEDGTIAHSELRCDDVVLMVSSYDADYQRPPLVGRSTGGGLYLVLDDAAAVEDRYRRGIEAGGSPVFPPEDTKWGPAGRGCSIPKAVNGVSAPTPPASRATIGSRGCLRDRWCMPSTGPPGGRGWPSTRGARPASGWCTTRVRAGASPTTTSWRRPCASGGSTAVPRTLDDAQAMLYVAPRKPRSSWSRANKRRVGRAHRGRHHDRARTGSGRGGSSQRHVERIGQGRGRGPSPMTWPPHSTPSPAARREWDAFRSARRAILEWLGAPRSDRRPAPGAWPRSPSRPRRGAGPTSGGSRPPRAAEPTSQSDVMTGRRRLPDRHDHRGRHPTPSRGTPGNRAERS